MKKYQGIFILLPSVDEAAQESNLEQINVEIKKSGGKVEATTRLGRIAFARPIRRHESGFYVMTTFQMAANEIAALRKRMKLNEFLLRVEIFQAPENKSKPAHAEIQAQVTSES